MARKALATVLPPATEVDEQAVSADLQSLDSLVVAHERQDVTVRAVAHQLGYQLPADCTDPDLIQRDIAANMRRSVEACLEVGRGLAVLKAACGHGNFAARLDVLGLDRKVAAKFMQASTKFSNVSSTRHLIAAAGNQTKLFEMLVLDDEQIEELELTGQTGELNLDDVATMSVKELRKAVREAREQATAKDRLLSDKNAKLDSLEMRMAKMETGSVPLAERIEPVMDEVAEFSKRLDLDMRNLAVIFAAIEEIAGAESEKPQDEADMEGVLPLVQRLRDAINRSATAGARLQFEFEGRLQHYIGAAEMFLAQDAGQED